MSASQILPSLPEDTKAIATLDKFLYQRFEQNGRNAGGVQILLYKDLSKLEIAYKCAASFIEAEAPNK